MGGYREKRGVSRVPSSIRRRRREEREETGEGREGESRSENGGDEGRKKETERNRAEEEGEGETSQECVGPSARVSSHPVFGVALYWSAYACTYACMHACAIKARRCTRNACTYGFGMRVRTRRVE